MRLKLNNMNKVIIELEVENCSDCPNYNYEGTSWSEDVYKCKKLNCEVNGKGIPSNCPFIESTMEKLRKQAVVGQNEQLICPVCGSDKTYKTEAIYCNRCAVTSEI